jgi:hypothetical protein
MLLGPPRQSGQFEAGGDIAVSPEEAAMGNQYTDLIALLIDKGLAFTSAPAFFEPRSECSFAEFGRCLNFRKTKADLIARAVFVVAFDLPCNRFFMTDLDQADALERQGLRSRRDTHWLGYTQGSSQGARLLR